MKTCHQQISSPTSISPLHSGTKRMQGISNLLIDRSRKLRSNISINFQSFKFWKGAFRLHSISYSDVKKYENKKVQFLKSTASMYKLYNITTPSLKVRNEIGKNGVGKFELKLGKFLLFNTALKTFQLRSAISNLNRKFLTSDFLTWNFPTYRFSNCPFQL